MQAATPERVYRLDSFTVPERARDEFISRVRETHTLLREQPGFIQDFLLEQPAGGDAFRLVTLVEWESSAVIEGARARIQTLHEQRHFDPQAFFERLDIQSELGTYRSIW